MSPSPSASEEPGFEIVYESPGIIDYEKTWPDKTVLVWAHSDWILLAASFIYVLVDPDVSLQMLRNKYSYGMTNDIIVRYNNHLVASGCDYVVKFISDMRFFDQIKKDIIGKKIKSPGEVALYYQPWLRELKSDNEQVDLVSLGGSISYQDSDEDSPTYGQMLIASENPKIDAIKDLLVADITEYLLDGQDTRLYDSVPEYIWSLTAFDNKIYGIHPSGIFGRRALIKFNESIMAELDLTKEDVDSYEKISKVLDYVYSLKKDEIDNGKFQLIENSMNESDYQLYGAISNDKNNISYKYDSKGHPYALNKYKDQQYVEFMEYMAMWASKGYFSERYFDINFYSGPIFEAINAGDWFMKVGDEYLTLTMKADTVSIVMNDWVFLDNFSDMVSVASWSQNKDMAYDLLSRLMTDIDLSNILVYGAEYDDVPSDAQLIEIGADKRANNDSEVSASSILVIPQNKQEFTVNEKKQIFNNLKPPAYLRFSPDLSKMDYDTEEFNRLISTADNLWHTDSDNFTVQLALIKNELDLLGYQDFINEINSLLSEYMNDFTYMKSK